MELTTRKWLWKDVSFMVSCNAVNLESIFPFLFSMFYKSLWGVSFATTLQAIFYVSSTERIQVGHSPVSHWSLQNTQHGVQDHQYYVQLVCMSIRILEDTSSELLRIHRQILTKSFFFKRGHWLPPEDTCPLCRQKLRHWTDPTTRKFFIHNWFTLEKWHLNVTFALEIGRFFIHELFNTQICD